MKNVFYKCKSINIRYDLKGSLMGRTVLGKKFKDLS